MKLLHQGQSRTQVCEQVRCSYDTLTSWIDKYLKDGLSGLVRPIQRQKPTRLSTLSNNSNSRRWFGERTVFFDEFAVSDRPSLFDGWAERNSRPEVKSDERQRHKLNGLLCVDAMSGEEFFRTSSANWHYTGTD